MKTEGTEPDAAAGQGEVPDESPDAEALRSLLRRNLSPLDSEDPELLQGVQRRIRQRSRGKFYADGWSTAREPPVATYLVTAVLMLLFMGFVAAALASPAGEPVDVPNAPAPIQIVPPPR